FVVGANVTIVSGIDGNIIVNVKGSRIALGEDMAMKIFI
ncbi:MAG: ferrous iron transport protein A, partial [Eubacterium coprostanoligenes]